MVIDVVQISSTVMITDDGPVTRKQLSMCYYDSHYALPTTVIVPTLLIMGPLSIVKVH